MNIITVGPKRIRSIVYEEFPPDEYDVLFIDEGKKLKQRISWQNDSWEFIETAGPVGGFQYEPYFDALQGISKKTPRQQGGKRSCRRDRR